jgi:hypothetical protein
LIVNFGFVVEQRLCGSLVPWRAPIVTPHRTKRRQVCTRAMGFAKGSTHPAIRRQGLFAHCLTGKSLIPVQACLQKFFVSLFGRNSFIDSAVPSP